MPSDVPEPRLATQFEELTTTLAREYTGNGECISPHLPDEAAAHDDAPIMVALRGLATVGGGTGDIVFI